MTYWRDTPLQERFEISHSPEPNTGCWIWTQSVDKDGYGLICKEKKQRRAHRMAYELFVGQIPKGILVCHICDTPSCVNPSHLFLGTAKDNTQDCIKKGRDYRPRGNDHPNSKVSSEDVDVIRRLRSYNLALKEIAAKFGLSFQHVSAIARGVSWKM